MSNLIKYNVDTAFTEDSTFETAVTSLATAGTGVGSVIANGTNLALLADLSIVLGSFNPSGSPYVEIHLIPLTGDGSTYADFFAAGPTLVATLGVTTGSSAKAFMAKGIIIPPGSFKLGMVNVTGATTGTGPKVYYRLYDYTDNG